MIDEEIRMHLAYGKYAGEPPTCGNKKTYLTEEEATKAAKSLNSSGKARHEVEPYPCFWCSEAYETLFLNWHIGRKMTEKEREVFSRNSNVEMEVIEVLYAEILFGEVLKEKQSLLVHNRLLCEGFPCSIHNPLDNPMKDWPLLWRADKGSMERVCPHGIGYPAMEDIMFRERNNLPTISVFGSCPDCGLEVY